jgi:xylulokinase
MEGAAFAVYHNLIIAEQQNVTVREWIGNGGAAQSHVWNQIKADVTGKPFVVPRQTSGKLGGHLLGLYVMVETGIERCDDPAARVESLLPNRQVFEPNLAHHALYRDLFATYRGLSDKLLPDFERLSATVQQHRDYLSTGDNA